MELHGYIQRSSGKTQGEAKAVVIVEKSATITGLGGIGKTQLVLKYRVFHKGLPHFNL